MDSQITLVKQAINALLSQDQSGHGIDHINRVLSLALKFARQENADPNLTTLIALLHDVDDYKLFGTKSAQNLPHAKKIMSDAKIAPEVQATICSEIQHLGYSKCLQGIRPQTLEGQIISDADMCDGLGAHGILRTCQYGSAHNRPFFIPDTIPNFQHGPQNYNNNVSNTSIDHFFEKLLLLKNLMLTPSGKHEAEAHAYPIR